jgi:hypothetical protein
MPRTVLATIKLIRGPRRVHVRATECRLNSLLERKDGLSDQLASIGT